MKKKKSYLRYLKQKPGINRELLGVCTKGYGTEEVKNDHNNVLGTRLYELRNEKFLTQLEVGKEIGLSSQAISNYERGRRMPNLSELIVLADYYQVTLDYLAGRTNKNEYKRLRKHSNQ